MGQVEAVEALGAMFAAADSSFGGGHARTALTAYMSDGPARWLRAPAAPQTHRRLLGATAQLCSLAAFMCFDSQLHGLAQRYYETALRLATQAQDRPLHAVVLRAMSVQAYSLGHSRECLRLAEAAAQSGAVPEAKAAALAGQLAVAAAADGSRRAALKHLAKAERHLERADDADGAPGSYHRAALLHQQAEVRAIGGDRVGAVAAMTQSIACRPADERRSRAVTHARLAEFQLDIGHVEAACATAARVCEDYPYLSSARTRSALLNLRARLRPHQGIAAALGLIERISVLTETGGVQQLRYPG
jgi:tetratricopeptide (TPR) repeat protein